MPETPSTILQLPHNIEAEQALLGACFLDPAIIAEAQALVRPEEFYRGGHGAIHRAIGALAASGREADWVTVSSELEAQGALGPWGTKELCQAYLQEITASTPSTYGWQDYARLVHDAGVRRALIFKCREIAGRAANDASVPATQIAGELGGSVIGLLGNAATTAKPIQEYVAEAEAQRDAGGVVGIPTGFPELDGMIGGLAPGRLIVVGARPKQGKSSLLTLFVSHVMAQAEDLGILMFSLEMSGAEVAKKLICMRAGVDSAAYSTGKLNASDTEKAKAAAQEVRGALWLDDTPRLTVQEVALRSRAHVAKHGSLGLVVVDYLGLCGGEAESRRGRQRYEEVGEVSRGLKILARELGCPVIAAHQLNRTSEDKPDEPPAMKHLRESGSIEQDADQILLLYPFKKDPETGEAVDPYAAVRPVDLIVAGNRHGPSGKIRMMFRRSCTRFEPVATSAPPALVDPYKSFGFRPLERSRYEDE